MSKQDTQNKIRAALLSMRGTLSELSITNTLLADAAGVARSTVSKYRKVVEQMIVEEEDECLLHDVNVPGPNETFTSNIAPETAAPKKQKVNKAAAAKWEKRIHKLIGAFAKRNDGKGIVTRAKLLNATGISASQLDSILEACPTLFRSQSTKAGIVSIRYLGPVFDADKGVA